MPVTGTWLTVGEAPPAGEALVRAVTSKACPVCALSPHRVTDGTVGTFGVGVTLFEKWQSEQAMQRKEMTGPRSHIHWP